MSALLILAALLFIIGFLWRLLVPFTAVGCGLFFLGPVLAIVAVLGRLIGWL